MLDLLNIIHTPTPIVQLKNADFTEKGIKVYIKKDFETHAELSGNKWRKLKYNLLEANGLGYKKLLTFGGAYSNHIYSMGAVAKHSNFEVHAIIRGEELNENSNETLQFAYNSGVKLHFVSRDNYRNKEKIVKYFGNEFYSIPEGGSNLLALAGMSEMVDEINQFLKPTHICCAMGTGGTCAGILSNKDYYEKIIGVPVLKGGLGLLKNVQELITFNEERLTILDEFHFGGYAKYNCTLLDFMKYFKGNEGIQLDRIYTAKLVYSIYDLVKKDYFTKGDCIVIYHSGGLR